MVLPSFLPSFRCRRSSEEALFCLFRPSSPCSLALLSAPLSPLINPLFSPSFLPSFLPSFFTALFFSLSASAHCVQKRGCAAVAAVASRHHHHHRCSSTPLCLTSQSLNKVKSSREGIGQRAEGRQWLVGPKKHSHSCSHSTRVCYSLFSLLQSACCVAHGWSSFLTLKDRVCPSVDSAPSLRRRRRHFPSPSDGGLCLALSLSRPLPLLLSRCL